MFTGKPRAEGESEAESKSHSDTSRISLQQYVTSVAMMGGADGFLVPELLPPTAYLENRQGGGQSKEDAPYYLKGATGAQ